MRCLLIVVAALVAAAPLAAQPKGDLNTFVKAFIDDEARTGKFDHPIWLRWAKVVGDDKPSRELFVQVLIADGAAEELLKLETEPKSASKRYPVELERIRTIALKRAFNIRSISSSLSIGEAAYGVYLGTFAGVTPIPPRDERGIAADPEMEVLESLTYLDYKARGPWSADASARGEWQAGNKPLHGPKDRLLAASLLNLKNSRTIEFALRRQGGLRDAGAMVIPLARMTCREKTFPLALRAASWLHLAEAGEIDYLQDIAAGQTDGGLVQQFWRSDQGKKEYLVRVSDVSIAAQLLLHGKKTNDFGFVPLLNEGKQAVDKSAFAYGFPDDNSRKAAHDKALAFLKDAPPPKRK